MTQVLVVKEGAHWEGGVTMTREPGTRPAPTTANAAGGSGAPQGGAPRPAQGAQGAAGGGSIFSKGDREGQKPEGQPAGQGGGGQ